MASHTRAYLFVFFVLYIFKNKPSGFRSINGRKMLVLVADTSSSDDNDESPNSMFDPYKGLYTEV